MRAAPTEEVTEALAGLGLRLARLLDGPLRRREESNRLRRLLLDDCGGGTFCPGWRSGCVLVEEGRGDLLERSYRRGRSRERGVRSEVRDGGEMRESEVGGVGVGVVREQCHGVGVMSRSGKMARVERSGHE